MIKLSLDYAGLMGTFDHNYCISREQEAINWSRQLFKEYESFKEGYMSINDIKSINV